MTEFVSIRGGLLREIDDEHLQRIFARFQFEAQLFLKRTVHRLSGFDDQPGVIEALEISRIDNVAAALEELEELSKPLHRYLLYRQHHRYRGSTAFIPFAGSFLRFTDILVARHSESDPLFFVGTRLPDLRTVLPDDELKAIDLFGLPMEFQLE